MCTLEKRGNIYILTLTGVNNDEQHRLNPTLITDLRSILHSLKSHPPTVPSALITTATGKFFSNGFDLNWAQSQAQAQPTTTFTHHLGHLVETFKGIIADLLSLPMPTIAAVSGHAAAAGFALALSHDYFLMNGQRGVLYMSELDIGMTLPEYFSVLFRERLGSRLARRDALLGARKIKAAEGERMGIVDGVYDGVGGLVDGAVKLGEELVGRKWNGEVYCEIRKSLYPYLCMELGLSRKDVVVPFKSRL